MKRPLWIFFAADRRVTVRTMEIPCSYQLKQTFRDSSSSEKNRDNSFQEGRVDCELWQKC